MSNIYITMHSTIVIIVIALLLTTIVLNIRCFKVERKPSHRNVKQPYAITITTIWIIVMLLLIN